MASKIECPKCRHTGGGPWTVRRLAHSGERAVECPSCGALLTEDFLRDVQGIRLP